MSEPNSTELNEMRTIYTHTHTLSGIVQSACMHVCECVCIFLW